VHKQYFKDQCVLYKDLLYKEKSEFHRSQICESEPKDLFRVVDKLSTPRNENALPSYDSSKVLADNFANFFESKVNNLRRSLPTDVTPPKISEKCRHSFSEFAKVSEDDVQKIIKSATITSCSLDPLPAELMKTCLPELLPTIIKIINASLTTGVVPSSLKHAVIRPLLKKAGLDNEVFSNYRPISNLPFLGKIIERVAVSQLQSYLSTNKLHSRMQSAYRKYHSTETAILRVQNDILCGLDQQQEAILVLLDFSAAFDTIEHGVLLDRLSERYGITGKALDWIKSYMSSRTQSVIVDDVPSDPIPLAFGVPQGSVAGPLLFTLYSAPLQEIVEAHGIKCVFYADDSQLYLVFNPEDRDSVLRKLEACIAAIRAWCAANKLVLNDNKTELVHFVSRYSKSSAAVKLTIGGSEITASRSARNLGAIMDDALCMSEHVDSVCKSAMIAIRKIGQIRQYLDADVTARLVHAFVTARLDSANSLLYGLSQNEVMKIQRVLCKSRREHITPLLCKLHWLPVEYRAMFKILLLAFKAMNAMAPSFICDLITPYVPKRQLRSSSAKLLQTRDIMPKTIFYGNRAFVEAAPYLWNGLPEEVRKASSVSIFKSRLKTHLFRQYFEIECKKKKK